MCFTCYIFASHCVSGSHPATISTHLQCVATIRRQCAMKAFTGSNLKSCGYSAFHISVITAPRHSNRFTSGCAAVRCFTTLIRIFAWNSNTLWFHMIFAFVNFQKQTCSDWFFAAESCEHNIDLSFLIFKSCVCVHLMKLGPIFTLFLLWFWSPPSHQFSCQLLYYVPKHRGLTEVLQGCTAWEK